MYAIFEVLGILSTVFLFVAKFMLECTVPVIGLILLLIFAPIVSLIMLLEYLMRSPMKLYMLLFWTIKSDKQKRSHYRKLLRKYFRQNLHAGFWDENRYWVGEDYAYFVPSRIQLLQKFRNKFSCDHHLALAGFPRFGKN